MDVKNLYFVIIQALLGFNIFRSLFGRDSVGDDECGSMFFRAADSLNCDRMLNGKLIEAIASAVFLGIFTYAQRQNSNKENQKPKTPRPNRAPSTDRSQREIL